MAAHVLGGRVQDDVGAESQRPLQRGGGEGAVDQEAGAGNVRRLGEASNVEDLELRIGRRLGPDERGREARSAQRCRRRAGVREVNEDRLHPPAAEEVDRQLADAGVDVGVKEDADACREGLENGRGGGHSGREGERGAALIDRRQRLFEAVLGGIALALVGPGVEWLALGAVQEGGGEVNRRGDRAGLPVGLPPCVYGDGFEAHAGELTFPPARAARGRSGPRCPWPRRPACRTARAAACRTAHSPRASAAR